MVPDCPRAILDIVGDQPWLPLEPTDLADGTRSAGTTGPVDGDPAGRWWRLGDRWWVHHGGPDGIGAARDRMAWLGDRSRSGHAPGLDPGAVAAVSGEWMVVDPPAGEPADQPERHPELVAICPAVGRSLARLHRLDPTDAPPGAGWAADLVMVEQAVAEHRFDVDRLPEPYRRHQPDRLLAIAADGPVGRPGPEPGPPVVGHGRASPATILLAGDEPAGLMALDRLGVTDRHRDLAAIQRRLHAVFGVDGVVAFAAGYTEAGGADIDLVRLDHGVLIEVLLDAVIPAGAVTT
ncbi:MAG: phosphotransferase [Acidimicrobiales bacterium]